MKTLQDILYGVSIEAIVGATTIPVKGVVFDSRNVKIDFVYVAQKGVQVDGHDFISHAISNGAKVIVCEFIPAECVAGVAYVKVENETWVIGKTRLEELMLELKIEKYEILEEEMGVIPMTDFPFHKKNNNTLTKIGTAGGWVKPSSGYAFKNCEKYASTVAENIKAKVALVKNGVLIPVKIGKELAQQKEELKQLDNNVAVAYGELETIEEESSYEKLKQSGYFVEVSGVLKDILKAKGAPIVTDEEVIRKVLKGKEIELNDNGSYQREIGGKVFTKMLMGNPKV